jgi:hypothetical protein
LKWKKAFSLFLVNRVWFQVNRLAPTNLFHWFDLAVLALKIVVALTSPARNNFYCTFIKTYFSDFPHVLHFAFFPAATTTAATTAHSFPNRRLHFVHLHVDVVNLPSLEKISDFAKRHAAAVTALLAPRLGMCWWLSGNHLGTFRASFATTWRQPAAKFPLPRRLVHAGTDSKAFVKVEVWLEELRAEPIDDFKLIVLLGLQRDIVNNFMLLFFHHNIWFRDFNWRPSPMDFHWPSASAESTEEFASFEDWA